MKKLKLKKLVIRNFKGIDYSEVLFEHRTIISGKNETFKSSHMDAYLYLLFGKDMYDRPATGKGAFNIKRQDKEGNVVSRLIVSVEGTFELDGEEITLERQLKEDWGRPRNVEQEVLTGHTGKTFIGGDPIKLSDFQAYINSIAPEGTFKLLSNAMHFNSLDWAERRRVIFDVAGEIGYIDAAKTSDRFADILVELKKGRELDAYQASIKAIIRKLKEEQDSVDARIDEVKRNIITGVNEDEIKAKIKGITQDIVMIDKSIADKYHVKEVWANEAAEHRKEIRSIEEQASDRELEATKDHRKAISSKSIEIEDAKSLLGRLSRDMAANKDRATEERNNLARLQHKIKTLQEEYEKVKSKKLDPNSLVCGECKRPLEDTHDHEASFNQNRAEMMAEINNAGTDTANAITKSENIIDGLSNTQSDLMLEAEGVRKKMQTLTAELEELKSSTPQVDISDLKEEIEIIKAKIGEEPTVDISDLTEKKEVIKAEMVELHRTLEKIDASNKADKRIKEIRDKAKEDGASLARNEAIIDDIQALIKARIDMMDSTIKEKFGGVTFKMFDIQVDGNPSPTCVTMVQGEVGLVPWPSANTAGKINSGVQIINALNKHYEMNLPIWIDNSEAVNDVEPSDSQSILLEVTKEREMNVKYIN